MAQKTRTADPPRGIAYAVTEYLSGLRLAPSERVLGALALMLAESLEEAPVYARAPLAGKLSDVMLQLADAEPDPATIEFLQGLAP